ncbi:hypothetical protein CYMTET_30077 [Cymbomonas tetramitiformis]|uniref:Uncharacterized protein n=1 Tax=Cymbomonas tetramitiformis TaxID=36881 RepID=A0AAE0FJR6_9CHLO|nr:hypothetical protein CYMTET_30077 [Cymbomonas tetramitiformis]
MECVLGVGGCKRRPVAGARGAEVLERYMSRNCIGIDRAALIGLLGSQRHMSYDLEKVMGKYSEPLNVAENCSTVVLTCRDTRTTRPICIPVYKGVSGNISLLVKQATCAVLSEALRHSDSNMQAP